MRWGLLFLLGCAQADLIVPPPPSSAPSADRSDVETFAIDAMFLGDGDWNGTISNAAWQQFGYDLDHLTTTHASTDVCTFPRDFGNDLVPIDGVGGVDNVWGKAVLPILETATSTPTPSLDATAQISAGLWTLEIQTAGLSTTGDTRTGIGAEVFVGANVASEKTFANWPVLASSVADGATIAGGARVTYDSGYVTNGTFVSGATSDEAITIPLRLFSIEMDIVIHHAVITFVRSNQRLEKGIIAGVLDTEEFIAALRRLAGRVSVSLCGTAFDGIADQLRQTQDILSDETNAPNVPCNAISIGIGFTARQIANPTQVVADPPPLTDACSALDAGAD